MIRKLCFIALLILYTVDCSSQEYQSSVDMRIPFTPGMVTISGKSAVYYELYLTGFSRDTIILRKVEVFDALDSTLVAQKELESILAPEGSGVIYLEPTLQQKKAPIRLYHRITMEIRRGASKKMLAVQGAVMKVSQKPPVILGAPLAGGPWTAVYDPSWQRGHRRVIYTVDGKARIPGRYAIDFIKLDSQGRYAAGDNDVVKNWYGYGAEVLAVAGGTIAAARDDFTESATVSGRQACPPGKATGNYIAIDIGNDHIVFYEHLRPGSIRVKPGQVVRKGAVIASLGFTGETTGPHLHFHVADRNSPLGAEGIPYVFDRFTILGAYADLEKFGKEPWASVKVTRPATVVREHPAPRSVIQF